MALIEYKKAGLRYTVISTMQAGIELSGAEAKAVRKKQGKLDGARVIIRGGEAFVVGMSIPPYQVGNTPAGYDPDRTRRLLLKKSEIVELAEEEAKKGLTVVPLEVYNAGRYLKVRVAVVRGKNKSDKRETLKLKDAKREMDRAMRAK
ncbi:MAG: SsrA-binding protein SsrA-binding protein [Parcubacteria group bacterium]|nr:SsrA-binding protein SsrA-binding protein [Parcubacteria group bacterium]